jgi:branched-chain amino acid transport system substrate-binding protein
VHFSQAFGLHSKRVGCLSPRWARLACPLLTWLTLVLSACNFSGDPIRIGLAGSLSDPVGLPMKRAAELAVEQINAEGGIKGRPRELVVRDD